jgi:hypothetical protein
MLLLGPSKQTILRAHVNDLIRRCLASGLVMKFICAPTRLHQDLWGCCCADEGGSSSGLKKDDDLGLKDERE